MRLIDADVAMKNVLDEIRYKESLYTLTVRRIAQKAIDAAPTIDPESLRPTANWKRIQDVAYMCTHCKSCFAFIPYNYQYCPECGAKMLNAYAFARER